MNKKWSQKVLKLLHKFWRYTKHQKRFVLYLLVLAFFLLFLPIVKVGNLDEIGGASRFRMLGTSYFKTMIVVFISLALLIGRNTSFRFKNMMISYFGIRENDALINFILLWIMVTAFFSISDTIGIVDATLTSQISFTGRATLIELILLWWLIMTLLTVIRSAKVNHSKTKIINMVDDHNEKEEHNKKNLRGLFEEEQEEVEE